MTAKRARSRSHTSRRELLKTGLGAGASALAMGAVSRSAAAQDSQWWEKIIGHGTQFDTARDVNREERIKRRRKELKDLREGPIPLRSDEMLENLRGAVERYQQIVQRGGWPKVPGPRMMRPGDDDERVPLLRRRLRASGDLGPPRYNYEGFGFDGDLEQGLMRFQQRHGLRVRGRVDRPTFAALNIPADLRLAQLRLNMQRVRELIRERIEDRYILVNVPAFQLEAVERYEVQRRHRVIVGRSGRETPSIKATIQGLNFFPYWRVPDSVARMDLFPRLQKEPDYLAKEHIRALRDHFNGEEIDPSTVDWSQADTQKIKFKQDPGEWNALGLVRIDMPNEHIVYMHDTPMKNLFDQSARAYSAGCVRVQNVMELVEWIAQYE
ncbi:MAG: L,D-transpeptidase family protein, partial [Pseudomonadota bacterium]